MITASVDFSFCSDDLLLMSTPPLEKGKAAARHPAVRALEGQLLPGDSPSSAAAASPPQPAGAAPAVDILTATPDSCLDVSTAPIVCALKQGGAAESRAAYVSHVAVIIVILVVVSRKHGVPSTLINALVSSANSFVLGSKE